MKRFLIRFLLAGIVLLFLGAKFVDVSAGQTLETDPIVRAWQATSVEAREFVVDGWGMKSGTFVSLTEVERVGRQISKQLGLSTATPTIGEESSFRYFTLQGQMKDGTLAVVTVQSTEGEQSATHLGILLAGKGSTAQLPQFRRRVLTLLAGGGQPGEVSVAISGMVDGQMDEGSARALCNRVTAAVGGKRVGYHRDQSGVTLSLYSAGLGTAVDFGGDRVNLQLTVRFDPELRQTEVTMASPIITEFS